MTEKIAYKFKGVWNPGGNGYYEFFGGPDGIPTRDLTEDEVSEFSKVQRDKLNSDAGKRLYQKSGGGGNSPSKTQKSKSSSSRPKTTKTPGPAKQGGPASPPADTPVENQTVASGAVTEETNGNE